MICNMVGLIPIRPHVINFLPLLAPTGVKIGYFLSRGRLDYTPRSVGIWLGAFGRDLYTLGQY